MKVVIQNGVRHALHRQDVEAIVQFFPSTWKEAVNSIVLYQTNEPSAFATYHPKEKLVGLYWPSTSDPVLSMVAAIDELLIAMAAIVELGEVPNNLSGTRRAQFLNDTAEIRKRCLHLVGVQP